MFRPDGVYHLLTLTAPGDDLHCKREGCSRNDCVHEKCACTPLGGVDLAEWNPTASKRWNHLLTLIERRYGSRPQYFRAVECQDGKRRVDGCGRNALHLHVLVKTNHTVTHRTVKKLAMQSGFGHSVDLKPLAPGSKAAARYVAKYVAKSCDARDDVAWSKLQDVVDDDGVITEELRPAPPTFRTWSQSKNWGTSMKVLREVARRHWEKLELIRIYGSPEPIALVLDAAGSSPPG